MGQKRIKKGVTDNVDRGEERRGEERRGEQRAVCFVLFFLPPSAVVTTRTGRRLFNALGVWLPVCCDAFSNYIALHIFVVCLMIFSICQITYCEQNMPFSGSMEGIVLFE